MVLLNQPGGQVRWSFARLETKFDSDTILREIKAALTRPFGCGSCSLFPVRLAKLGEGGIEIGVERIFGSSSIKW